MTSIKQKPKIFFIKSFNIFITVIVIIGGIYYLAGVNNLAVKGFALKELKDQVDKLADEKQNLELSVMSLQSYNNINDQAEKLKMVVASNIEYISVKSSVAKK